MNNTVSMSFESKFSAFWFLWAVEISGHEKKLITLGSGPFLIECLRELS